MNNKDIQDMLIKHEGLVCSLYKCSMSANSIGVGRNLDANGISEEEAMFLLQNDIDRVIAELDDNLQGWRAWPLKARIQKFGPAEHRIPRKKSSLELDSRVWNRVPRPKKPISR